MRQTWGEDIGDGRFIPFIQLHEYEAYLFVDVTKLGVFYTNAGARIGRLRAISDATRNPELIDDGDDTAPSRRIIGEFPEYEGGKTTVGPQVAEAIGLHEIRAKCPHFAQWPTQLEGLGGDSQVASPEYEPPV